MRAKTIEDRPRDSALKRLRASRSKGCGTTPPVTTITSGAPQSPQTNGGGSTSHKSAGPSVSSAGAANPLLN